MLESTSCLLPPPPPHDRNYFCQVKTSRREFSCFLHKSKAFWVLGGLRWFYNATHVHIKLSKVSQWCHLCVFWIQKLSLFLISMCKLTHWTCGNTSLMLQIFLFSLDAITVYSLQTVNRFQTFYRLILRRTDGWWRVREVEKPHLASLDFTTAVI